MAWHDLTQYESLKRTLLTVLNSVFFASLCFAMLFISSRIAFSSSCLLYTIIHFECLTFHSMSCVLFSILVLYTDGFFPFLFQYDFFVFYSSLSALCMCMYKLPSFIYLLASSEPKPLTATVHTQQSKTQYRQI